MRSIRTTGGTFRDARDHGDRPMTFARLGGIFALLAVALGAFGAHLLRDQLGAALSHTFETGVRYQMFHALALILVDVMRGRTTDGGFTALGVAGVLFTAGIVLFSGSLYAMALTGIPAFGAITPLGGAAFLAGWVAFAIGCRRA
jgi:uncharacterized membrane protein YgdD (TMEM256/DUF423 family)